LKNKDNPFDGPHSPVRTLPNNLLGIVGLPLSNKDTIEKNFDPPNNNRKYSSPENSPRDTVVAKST